MLYGYSVMQCWHHHNSTQHTVAAASSSISKKMAQIEHDVEKYIDFTVLFNHTFFPHWFVPDLIPETRRPAWSSGRELKEWREGEAARRRLANQNTVSMRFYFHVLVFRSQSLIFLLLFLLSLYQIECFVWKPWNIGKSLQVAINYIKIHQRPIFRAVDNGSIALSQFHSGGQVDPVNKFLLELSGWMVTEEGAT